ncbi:MAG TPA: hypothetical protein VLT13_05890 [Bacteroidota bacterium]|nr:hypothetical protein [Bacteroidota bacterium]
MSSSDLLTISLVGYVVAFAVLALLAIVMRLITLLFPEQEDTGDAAVVAAVSATYQALCPGTTVTKIEETR